MLHATEGAPPLTGLEGSAVGGQGSGITPFVPSRQMFSLTSSNLKVDISPFVNEALRGFGSAAASETGNTGTLHCRSIDDGFRTTTHVAQYPGVPGGYAAWSKWSESDIEGDEDADLDRKLQVKEQVVELASKLLTGSYARKQAAAGRKCGIEVGARDPLEPVVHIRITLSGVMSRLSHSRERLGGGRLWLQPAVGRERWCWETFRRRSADGG